MSLDEHFSHNVPVALNMRLPRATIQQGGQLKRYTSYGTEAVAVYDEGCKCFGWNRNRRSSFTVCKPLHAVHATPEGFSVWFLCHSDAAEKRERFDRLKRWNFIHEDEIAEEDRDARVAGIVPSPDEYRLTFVKNWEGVYVYLGVFAQTDVSTEPDTGVLRRIFTRVPEYDVYPLKNT